MHERRPSRRPHALLALMAAASAPLPGCSWLVASAVCDDDHGCPAAATCVGGHCVAVVARGPQDWTPGDAADVGVVGDAGHAGDLPDSAAREPGLGSDPEAGPDPTVAPDGERRGEMAPPSDCVGADADGDGWKACDDCDDGRRDAHPGAAETCNLKDDDCDGLVDTPCPQERAGWPVHLGWPALERVSVAVSPGFGRSPGVVYAATAAGPFALATEGAILPGFPALPEWRISTPPALAPLPTAPRAAGDVAIVAAENGMLAAIGPDGVAVEGWAAAIGRRPTRGPAVDKLRTDHAGPSVAIVDDGGVAHLIDWEGRPRHGRWPVLLDGAGQGVAFADLDGDRALDIVITTDAGSVYALAESGAAVEGGWPAALEGGGRLGDPVVVDVLPQVGPEVWVAGEAGRLFLLDARGLVQAGWPVRTQAGLDTALSAGDIDGDGVAEVAATDHVGTLHLLTADGRPASGWPRGLGARATGRAVWADLTGDGAPELLVATEDDWLHAIGSDGTPLAGWPVRTPGTVRGRPAVADLDDDGRADVVVSTAHGAVGVWELGPGSFGATRPWPTDRGGNRRTGFVR